MEERTSEHWIEIPSWQGVRGYQFGMCTAVMDLDSALVCFDGYIQRRPNAIPSETKIRVRLVRGDRDNPKAARVVAEYPGPLGIHDAGQIDLIGQHL